MAFTLGKNPALVLCPSVGAGGSAPSAWELEPRLNDITMGAFNFAGSGGKIDGDSLAVIELAWSIDAVAITCAYWNLVVGHGFRLNMHGEFVIDGRQLPRLRIEVVYDKKHAEIGWQTEVDGAQKPEKLGTAVTAVQFVDHYASGEIEGSEQRSSCHGSCSLGATLRKALR